jgi:N-acetylglucosamine-6-phosphate deacetylase
MLEFACRTKTPDKVTLISDSVAPTGMGDGEFEIWGEKIRVDNGRTQNERGSIAGSVITMRDALNRMVSLGFSSPQVSRMASVNPAALLGIESERGSLAAAKRADIVGLDAGGEVRLTMVEGRVVFDDR